MSIFLAFRRPTLHYTYPKKRLFFFLFFTLHNHTYIENAIKYYSIQLWIAWQRRKEFTVIFFCFSLLCFCFGYFMFCRLNMCSCVVLQVVHSSRVNIKFASLLLCGIVRLNCMGLYMNNMWIYIYIFSVCVVAHRRICIRSSSHLLFWCHQYTYPTYVVCVVCVCGKKISMRCLSGKPFFLR